MQTTWQFYEFRREKNEAFYEYRWMPRKSPPSTLFGRRLRDARSKVGIPQDKLGVMIGMDEGSSSARISRYETGVHEPPFVTATSLAAALHVPAAYFYCADDRLADLLILFSALEDSQKDQLLALACELSESSA